MNKFATQSMMKFVTVLNQLMVEMEVDLVDLVDLLVALVLALPNLVMALLPPPHVAKCQDKSAEMFQDRFPDKNVPMSQDKNVRMFLGNNVTMSQDKNVTMFQDKNVAMYPVNSATMFQDNSAR